MSRNSTTKKCLFPIVAIDIMSNSYNRKDLAPIIINKRENKIITNNNDWNGLAQTTANRRKDIVGSENSK